MLNSPVLHTKVQPRMEEALFYETARLVGIQAVTGFAVLGVYLAGKPAIRLDLFRCGRPQLAFQV